MAKKMLNLEDIDKLLERKDFRGILNDRQIKELCLKGMITPFSEGQIRKGVISSGLSSFGYDITLGITVKVFKKPSLIDKWFRKKHLDPKNFDKSILQDLPCHYDNTTGLPYVILPPHSFSLGHTVETFNVPEDVMCLCTCKSTLARVGLSVNCTSFEPEFVGQITMELSNQTTYPMKVYLREGIAQVLFFRGDRPEVTYADKKGKYQGQSSVTIAKV